MTEKLPYPDDRNAYRTRGALVAAGVLLVATAAFIPTEKQPVYNFKATISGELDSLVRVVPESCNAGGRAVGLALTEHPQAAYLGISRDGAQFENAIHIEGTRQSLTLTPMVGPERTIFAQLIPLDQVMQLPMEHDDMIVQIGRGPSAGNDERMIVAVGCSQEGIDEQSLFFKGQKIIHVPPMKESP